jgi:hypothetical protein
MNEADRGRLEALIQRIVPYRDGLYRFAGPITSLELQSLRSSLGSPVDGAQSHVIPAELNLSLLTSGPPADALICIDFGTAASKIGWLPPTGLFEPLEIGGVAGADEPDPFWVRSAIAIDENDRIVFGRRAELAAERVGGTAVTSFKSKLWEDPHKIRETALESEFATFSYEDCILAYLAFLTHVGEVALSSKGQPAYTARRYAMPYAYDPDRKQVRELLGELLGKAAILADTLGSELLEGVESGKLRSLLDAVATVQVPDWLKAQPPCVGEPVAAGNFAMDLEIGRQTVYMIVDIGAGTTDFCILCLKKRGDTEELEPIQIRDGTLSVPLAGDAIDLALVNFLIRVEQAEEWRNYLFRNVRAIKERLFDDGSVDIELPGQALIYVRREDFIASPEWQRFVQALSRMQAQCFDQADRVYLENYGSGAIRVVITGGGSRLPVRDALASGRSPGEVKVERIHAEALPDDILNQFGAIESLLPRLAVALGGVLDSVPADHDRTAAKTSSGFAGRRAWKPVDKTHSGLDEDDE